MASGYALAEDGIEGAEGFPVLLSPEKLDAAAREAVAALKPDLLVSFAYGRIFGPKFLSLCPLGGINIHPSLLPRWRGATPIPAAILNRDEESGISIQTLSLKMDQGDILLQTRFPLVGNETTASLSERVAGEAPALLESVLERLAAGDRSARAQDDSAATLCPLITKEDGHIDWSQSARTIEAMVRAYTPWPLAHTSWEGQGLSILEAALYDEEPPMAASAAAGQPAAGEISAGQPGLVMGIDKKRGILIQTGDGVLYARRLHLAARKALDWQAFANGTRGFIGSTLGTGGFEGA